MPLLAGNRKQQPRAWWAPAASNTDGVEALELFNREPSDNGWLVFRRKRRHGLSTAVCRIGGLGLGSSYG